MKHPLGILADQVAAERLKEANKHPFTIQYLIDEQIDVFIESKDLLITGYVKIMHLDKETRTITVKTTGGIVLYGIPMEKITYISK